MQSGLGREIGELLEPKVDWRELLREFVKATCSAKDASSWRRVNRRYLSGETYMPSLIGERVGHLVIGIDTSGSIGGQELNDFLTEVKGIANEVHPEKVDLMYWDTEVAGHEEYAYHEVDNIVSSTKPRGGGGTDPTCMIECMKEKNSKPEAKYHPYIMELLKYNDEDGDYLVNGFKSEYSSKDDFKVSDLGEGYVRELYELRPELFRTIPAKLELVKLGLMDRADVNTMIRLEVDIDDFGEYFQDTNYSNKI